MDRFITATDVVALGTIPFAMVVIMGTEELDGVIMGTEELDGIIMGTEELDGVIIATEGVDGVIEGVDRVIVATDRTIVGTAELNRVVTETALVVEVFGVGS